MKKLFTILFVFLYAQSSFAQDDEKSAATRKFVEEIGNKVITIAAEKTSDAARRAKIVKVIDDVIDAEWIGRFVLGKNYKSSTELQRQRFTNLYRDFMINTYGPKFKDYNGRKFTVNEVIEQGGFYIAKAEFLPRDSNTPISVDFRVKERNGKLVILDFIAEGISLIETQRSEFNSAISQKGTDKFLDELTERVEKLKKAK
jgi:phospholipid transport system substrate-binding protein